MKFDPARYEDKDDRYRSGLAHKYRSLPWKKKLFVKRMAHRTVQQKYVMHEHIREKIERYYPALKKDVARLTRLTQFEFEREYAKLKPLVRNPRTPGRSWEDLFKAWMLKDEKDRRRSAASSGD